MKACFFLGRGAMGVFFPFFIAETFSLSLVQTLFLMAGIAFFMGIFNLPVNYCGGKYLSKKQMIQTGFLFHILFFLSISFPQQNIIFLSLSSLFFILFSSFFPAAFHLTALESTKEAERGSFFAHFQIINIGANLFSPIITGILLEMHKQEYIVFVAIFLFLLALFFSRNIHDSKLLIPPFFEWKQLFIQEFLQGKRKYAFFAEGVQSGSTMFLWPLFFKAVIGSFSIMGIITSVSAFFEVIVSKLFGKITDKKSAHALLQNTVFARFFDLAHRGIFVFFPHPVFVGVLNIVSGILGPIFGIPLATRIYEVAEEYKNTFSFLVIREMYLGITRGIFMFIVALVAWKFGIEWTAGFFVIAGFFAILLKRL